ncbi:MAG: cardiolipin synthase, partial [Rhodospirillales bacterium]|nr:cardiolipin synthase [Rhodospirillales bacterium]
PDVIGRRFIDALIERAHAGISVRVHLDAFGSVALIISKEDQRMRDAGIELKWFNPWRWYRPFGFNRRNHRKLLIIDDTVAFTGGMNIRAGHLQLGEAPIRDTHFRLDGPVVRHLIETFADDWAFATGTAVPSPKQTAIPGDGDLLARGIAAGPDESFERIRWAMLGALAVARRRVRIITPYFLPDPTMMAALMLAALRGVRVDIVLPAQGNLRLVQWASRAKLAPLLARGCLIWLTPPPFDHSKLMTVDGAWSLFGSANWDPRSLRLNFEFNIECYGERFAAALDAVIDSRCAEALPYTLADDQTRSLPTRLRDGAAWLLSPYL